MGENVGRTDLLGFSTAHGTEKQVAVSFGLSACLGLNACAAVSATVPVHVLIGFDMMCSPIAVQAVVGPGYEWTCDRHRMKYGDMDVSHCYIFFLLHGGCGGCGASFACALLQLATDTDTRLCVSVIGWCAHFVPTPFSNRC